MVEMVGGREREICCSQAGFETGVKINITV